MAELETISAAKITQKKSIHFAALELVIDAMSVSEATEATKKAGAYLTGLIIADSKGTITPEKLTAITSIMEMAAESQSPVFKV